VFFAMGYMVGRNSARNLLATTDPAATAPAAVDASRRQQPEPPRETAADPSAQSAPVDSPAPLETKPAQDATTPAAATVEPTKEAPAETKASHIAVATPEADATYLQVTALPHPDADNMIRTLREQSFPAILAASSKDGLYRVLVGPYHQTAQLAEAKARLKAIGFGSAFVQKQ